jgi:AbrB family looped-hinge helix DNA binding protein
MQIQQDIVKVQKKGLITIPNAFRENLGLEPGSLARITKVKGRLLVEQLTTPPYKVRSYKESEIKDCLALDKKESEELRSKGIFM